MADFYAEASGNDTTGNGSLATPWQSIDKLLQATVTAGDSLNVKYGEEYYAPVVENAKNAQNGTLASPIKLQAYGDATAGLPVIKCFAILTTWVSTGVTGGANTVWEHTSGSSILSQSNMLWKDGVQQTKLTYATSVAATFNDVANQAGYFAVDPAVDKVYYCAEDDPSADGSVYDAALNTNDYAYLLRFFDADHWLIQNIQFSGGYQGMFWLSGNSARLNTGITFRQCIFEKCIGDNIDGFHGASNGFEVTVEDCLFRNNVADSGGHGIQMFGSRGFDKLVLRRSRFYGMDHCLQLGNTTASTLAQLSSVHGEIEQCVFVDGNDDGIWLGRGNYIPDGQELNIHHCAFLNLGDGGATLNQTSALVGPNRNIKFNNNTIALCGQDGLAFTSFEGNAAKEQCRDNIVYLCNRGDVPSQIELNRDLALQISGPDIDNNIVFMDNNTATGVSRIDVVNSAGSILDTYNSNNPQQNFLDMRADLLPNMAKARFVDPQFALVTPLRPRDLRLRSNSPALGAGSDLGYTHDIEGYPIIGTPNIGAFQKPDTGTRLEVLERGRQIEIKYDISGTSLTETVNLVNGNGVITEVIHRPRFVDPVDAAWSLTLLDENGVDVLRGVGTTIGNVEKSVFVDAASTNLKYAMFTSTLQFVATSVGVQGGSGSIILRLE